MTELTLREKVRDVLYDYSEHALISSDMAMDRIASLLSATGAPAHIRVADDLRGVVREEGECDEPGCGLDLDEARANMLFAAHRYLDKLPRADK